jgi:hypothetical protein
MVEKGIFGIVEVCSARTGTIRVQLNEELQPSPHISHHPSTFSTCVEKEKSCVVHSRLTEIGKESNHCSQQKKREGSKKLIVLYNNGFLE